MKIVRFKSFLIGMIFLLTLSLASAADFTLTCPAEAGEDTFHCTLDYTELDSDNFGGFDFTVQSEGLTLDGRPTKVPESLSLQYNLNTGSGSLVYDFSEIEASGTLVRFPLKKAADAGASGTVTLTNLVFYEADSAEIPVQDISAEVTFEGVADVVVPPPLPPPPVPVVGGEVVVPPPPPPPPPRVDIEAGEEEEPEISRAPLTEADLADGADADGDGETNADDDDDDGDSVPDAGDSCLNTYIGAERVTEGGCLEGDLSGAEGDTPPDGCVNNSDVSAANWLDVLVNDGFGGLSSLLWGMFDNWNAGEGGC